MILSETNFQNFLLAGISCSLGEVVMRSTLISVAEIATNKKHYEVQEMLVNSSNKMFLSSTNRNVVCLEKNLTITDKITRSQ